MSGETDTRRMHYSRWIDDFIVSSDSLDDFLEFVGAMDLVVKHFSISRSKSFFQVNPSNYGESGVNNGEGVYLLGHTVSGNEIFKNSKEKRLEHKVAPFDYYDFRDQNLDYRSWIE